MEGILLRVFCASPGNAEMCQVASAFESSRPMVGWVGEVSRFHAGGASCPGGWDCPAPVQVIRACVKEAAAALGFECRLGEGRWSRTQRAGNEGLKTELRNGVGDGGAGAWTVSEGLREIGLEK